MPFFHQFVERYALDEKYADLPAIQFENDKQFTYRELDTKANQLAWHLLSKGVKAGDNIAVSLAPSVDNFVAVLALSKIGATYVPIDIATPIQRKHKIILDSKPSFIISTEGVSQEIDFDSAKTLYLDKSTESISQQKTISPPLNIQKRIAYIIYSSGTTGEPKGVPISDEGLFYWDEVLREDLSNRPKVAVASIISHAFDAHLWEAQMAWSVGGTLHVASQTTRRDLSSLIEFLKNHEITDVTLVPEQANAISDLDTTIEQLKERGLTAVYFTGSASTPQLVRAFTAHGIKYKNCYGPTEATYGVSEHEVDPMKIINGRVPIGFPRDDRIKLHILNEKFEHVADGEEGILYIESENNLSPGYLNREKETKANFINVILDGKQVRLYRTDDLFTKKDDLLYYHGRVGRALKINGVLVNLDEIEAHLRGHYNIQQVAVVAVPNGPQGPQLVAFIVTKDKKAIDKRDLQLSLTPVLTNTLTPNHFIFRENFPLTHSGKIDYPTLKELASQNIAETYKEEPVHPPRTPLELELSKIWKQILGISTQHALDIHKSFQEYGGSSLAFEAIIDRIKKDKIFPVDISIPDLNKFGFRAFDSNDNGKKFTIANLAKYIHHKRWEATNNIQSYPANIDLLVEGDKTNRPIFLIPPITGTGGANYNNLAKKLSNNRTYLDANIFTLKARGLFDPIDIHADDDELARDFAKSIQQIQPKGKILLLGWSFGGTLAYKIASILEKEYHRTIRFVGMIDTLSPIAYQKMDPLTFATEIYQLVKNLCETLQKPTLFSTLNLSETELAEHSQKKQIALIFDALLKQVESDPLIYNLIYVAKINIISILEFKQEELVVDLHVFNTAASAEKYGDRLLHWIHNKLVLYSGIFPGNHFSIMKDDDEISELVDKLVDVMKIMLGKYTPPLSDDSDGLLSAVEPARLPSPPLLPPAGSDDVQSVLFQLKAALAATMEIQKAAASAATTKSIQPINAPEPFNVKKTIPQPLKFERPKTDSHSAPTTSHRRSLSGGSSSP